MHDSGRPARSVRTVPRGGSSPTLWPMAADTISFARGAPSLDIIDVEGLKAAAKRALQERPGGTTAYGTAIGYPPLRPWIADRHDVDPRRCIVTNGSMQADAFLFDQLVAAGDAVVVERPTYDRTLLGLRGRGADIRLSSSSPTASTSTGSPA